MKDCAAAGGGRTSDRHTLRIFSALAVLLLAFILSGRAHAAGAVVFNEIHFHPATNESALEWLELHNQMGVDVDISEWRLAGGVEYTFPDGTIIAGRGYLVVALNPGAFAAQHPSAPAALGPFAGRLSNNGEKLELRNNSSRLMDEVTYGVDGDWPVAPDGSGATLAKSRPNAASQDAANWRASAQVGGTPGLDNFPATGTVLGSAAVITLTNHWRYHDLGIDLGTSWRAPGFNASAWSNGPALLFLEDSPLAAPKLTPLAPGRTTCYFRTSFHFSGDTNATLLALRPFIDDGAVFFLNGVEVARLNLPAGVIAYSTTASASVENASLGAALALPPSLLVNGSNTLAVEVHQAAAIVEPPPPAGLTLIEIGGAMFASNFSRNAAATAFGMDEIGGGSIPIHKIPNVRDGLYGNGNSWIGDSLNSFVGIRFGSTQNVGRVAWGRDNTSTYFDRNAGTYTLHYTRVASPGAVTTVTGDPATGWALVGSVTYPAGGAPWSLRHAYGFPPVDATGIRLTVPGSSFADGACIDELETSGPASSLALPRLETGGSMRAGNFATNSGATAFGKDEILGGSLSIHKIPNVRDGLYGNGNSWIGDSANSFIGVAFGTPRLVGRVAWGRDNTGTYSDRTAGSYTLQFTTNATPSAATPDAQWQTIGLVTLDAAATNSVRHLHQFPPVTATALRLITPGNGAGDGACLDELEIYAPDLEDIVFGAELTLTTLVAPPAKLAFNETASPTNPALFFIELINHGESAVSLGGCVLRRDGASQGEFSLPNQALAPGALVSFDETQLGFRPQVGDKLFLFTSTRDQVLDAVVVKDRLRGRSPDGSGRWLFPSVSTPGASNAFEFHRDVVINEIMYHPRGFEAVPAQLTTTEIVSLDGAWRYDDTGTDLGAVWRGAEFNDAAWPEAPAAFFVGGVGAPPPSRTALTPGRTAYYFRTRFVHSGSVSNAAFLLTFTADDGAIFHLNGVEIHRHNMPAGPVSHATFASAPLGVPTLGGAVPLPAAALVSGTNVLAVEVHQAGSYPLPPPNTNVVTNPGLTLTPAGGFTLEWDGNESEFYDASSTTPVPDNAAHAARGTVAFGSSELDYGGIHLLRNINDGRFGNSWSWIANINVGDPAPYVGLRFTGAVAIASIAWGRDNGFDAECCGGAPAADRSVGTYTIQFTTVASPGTATTETGDPASGWATLGTATYSSAQPGFAPSARHRFRVAQGDAPVVATGLRLKVSDQQMCIDEIEVNPAPAVGHADAAFAAALTLQQTNSPALPARSSPLAWVELHNRGTGAVNLTGWRLDEGIDFRFASNTMLAAGGFLVVAQNPAALAALHPAANIIGPYTNKLSHRGARLALKDAANNPADEVRYFDSGRWPEFADGVGSSLELRDPRADNALPEAWGASDESGRAPWTNVTFRAVAGNEYGPTQWHEFALGLLDTGEALVDDVSVIESPAGAATQLIANGNFESGASGWRFLGTHAGSAVITDPDNAGNHVLRLVAGGAHDDTINHIEATLLGNAAIVVGREYEISFRARWRAGSPRLNTRLYHNYLARTTRLPTPADGGTPGAVNSRRVANLGPTFANLRHAPVVPNAAQAVTVSVEAADPDGVPGATLFYAVDSGAFGSVAMSPSSGAWSANIPGQSAGAVVQFYVSAVDSLGGTATFPADGAESRALYQVQDGRANLPLAHNLRLIMTPADTDFIHRSTNVLSNARVGATVIYDESEVYYDTGVRLRGSQSARPLDTRIGWNIAFDPMQPLRGNVEGVAIDRSGGWRYGRDFGQDEILIKHMAGRAGGIPASYDDLIRVITPLAQHTGPALLLLDRYSQDWLDSEFQGGSDGPLFEFDAIYLSLTTVDGIPTSPKPAHPYGHPPGINLDIQDRGDNPETYRWQLRPRNNRDADDFSGIIPMAKAFSLTGAALDAQSRATMDVDEWLRVFALFTLCGVGDAYPVHNLGLYVRPKDGQVVALPWDWDFAFINAANSGLLPGGNFEKIIQLNQRSYYCHLQDIIARAFNSGYMTRWADHYDNFCPGQSFTDIPGYIAARAAFVQSQLPASAAFAVSSSLSTNTNVIVLGGTGPLAAKTIEVNGLAYEPVWTNFTSWTLVVQLSGFTNLLTLRALDQRGHVLSNGVLSVTATNTSAAPLLAIVINEWMADNAAPGGFADPADGLFQDWFELFNPNTNAVNLGGWFLTDEAALPGKFPIPSNTVIAARGFLLVWADDDGAQNGPGMNGDLHANFKLNSDGEGIALRAPDGTLQHSITFGAQLRNVSQGWWPDGNTAGMVHSMTNFTPRAANVIGGPWLPPRFVDVSLLPGGVVELKFPSLLGVGYRVDFKDDLNAAVWTPLGAPFGGSGADMVLTDSIGPPAQRFYRLVLIQ